MNLRGILPAILFALSCFPAHTFAQFAAPSVEIPAAPHQSSDSEEKKSIAIRSVELEFHTAYIEDFVMAGVMARLGIWDYTHVTIRYSVDLRTGANSWFNPYFGITVPKVGGFEVGVLQKPEAEFHVPGWVTWRVFGGDEKIFAISADILTNTPIGAIGYYNAGVQFRVSEEGSMMYIGFANYGKTRDEVFAFGPAVKTSWAMGEHSWILIDGSYILNNPDDTYVRYTLNLGWRMAF